MTITEFIAETELTDAAFAARIGVSRQALHRYKTGERRPEWGVIERIVAATNGAVTANDFLPSADVPRPTPPAPTEEGRAA